MCRLFSLFSIDNSSLGENGKGILLHLASNAFALHNRDGYFIADNRDKSIRTLSASDYFRFIQQTDFENSRWVTAHLRLSSNSPGEKWIHGWKFGGYYCTHNGVVQNKGFDNDSFSFFTDVIDTKKEIVEAIKETLEASTGWGVFSMVKDQQKIFFCKNRPMHLYYIKEFKLLAVLSSEDIWEFKQEAIEIENIGFELEQVGGLYLTKSVSKKERIALPKIDVIPYTREVEDAMLVVNERNLPGELINLQGTKRLIYGTNHWKNKN